MKTLSTDPEIHVIEVPLPNSPLKVTNAYVLTSEGETLLIDTGFRRPECIEVLEAGLAELKVDRSHMSIFITHLHVDHSGAVSEIRNDSTIVYATPIDAEMMAADRTKGRWEGIDQFYHNHGFPDEENIMMQNPSKKFVSKPYPITYLADGEHFMVGKEECVAIHTPGHTPGHMCLYIPRKKILFSGDHILFDISPNITCWPSVEDSLGDYLQSLDQIRSLDVSICYPGHRSPSSLFTERIDELKAHHAARLEECLRAVEHFPDSTAYEIGSHLTWHMQGKSWDDVHNSQKWFATGETIAHLDYLRLRGKITMYTDQNGYFRFKVIHS